MAGAKTKAKKPAVSAAKKGFGAATVVANTKRKRWAEGPPEAELDASLAALEEQGMSIVNFLNPALFEDPETLDDVGRRLRAGEVVVLKDAFRPEFAEATYRELKSKTLPWVINEAYHDDGYANCHLNVYDRG